jgi:hypothetical protein
MIAALGLSFVLVCFKLMASPSLLMHVLHVLPEGDRNQLLADRWKQQAGKWQEQHQHW